MAQKNKESQQCNNELEQYSRRLRLRIDSFPKQNNEKAEDVFKFVKGLVKEFLDLEIPKTVTDRAHRIGPDYTDKKRRKCVSLLLFAFQPYVIVQYFTELEGLWETERRLG